MKDLISSTRKYKNLEFWAENGFVVVYDKRDDTLEVISADEFEKRARAIWEMMQGEIRIDERIKKRQFVEDAREIVRIAREQICWDDPKHVAEVVSRQKRKTVFFTDKNNCRHAVQAFSSSSESNEG